ncbi:MAG TPA: hypothetical protein VD833_08445, partial [Vicinamibacterales bacterium]|nr:hypothetical protein [Vicinamibacterales bacterium]
LVHSAWWLSFTAFVGLAMVWFAATGFCIMANGLYWLGAEPRLVPERASADGGLDFQEAPLSRGLTPTGRG